MKYLVVYGATGIVVLAVMLLQSYLAEKKDPVTKLASLKYVGNPNPSLVRKFLEGVLVPALAGLLVIAFWPVALFFLAKSSIDESRKAKAAAEQAFRVSEQDLVEKLTISEIEQREMISDPHNAVPDLPFGHLHAAWEKYQRQLLSDHILWSFSVTWTDAEQHVEGYVAVQDGRIGPHFITFRRSLS